MAEPQSPRQRTLGAVVDFQQVAAIDIDHQPVSVRRQSLSQTSSPQCIVTGTAPAFLRKSRVPEARRPPLLALDVGQRGKRLSAVEGDQVASRQKPGTALPPASSFEFRESPIHATEERNLLRTGRTDWKALENLVQRQIVGHVFRHHYRQIGPPRPCPRWAS